MVCSPPQCTGGRWRWWCMMRATLRAGRGRRCSRASMAHLPSARPTAALTPHARAHARPRAADLLDPRARRVAQHIVRLITSSQFLASSWPAPGRLLAGSWPASGSGDLGFSARVASAGCLPRDGDGVAYGRFVSPFFFLLNFCPRDRRSSPSDRHRVRQNISLPRTASPSWRGNFARV